MLLTRTVLAACVLAAVCACVSATAYKDIQALKLKIDSTDIPATPLTSFFIESKSAVFCTDTAGKERACAHDNGVCCKDSGYCCPAGTSCVLTAQKTNHCHKKLGGSESSQPASVTSESAKPASSSLSLSESVSESSYHSNWGSLSSIVPSLSSGSGSKTESTKKKVGAAKATSSSGSSSQSGSKADAPANNGRPRSINVVNHIILNTTPNPVVSSGGVSAAPAAAPKFKAIDNSANIHSHSDTKPMPAVSAGRLRGVPKV